MIAYVDPPPPTTACNLQPHQWRLLWPTSISLSARTVWFRSLHHKLPTKAILHRCIPRDHPSPNCNLCSLSTAEDQHHFLFSCPLKFPVWK
ncbi:hypothetical protein G6F42_023714 [Rhizopus arrhizus]|nr:hypothetical protein G6F42_023714 [Rhizopus arrhizus]